MLKIKYEIKGEPSPQLCYQKKGTHNDRTNKSYFVFEDCPISVGCFINLEIKAYQRKQINLI